MQNEMQNTAATRSEKFVRGEGISWKRMPFAALLAALGAAGINAIVYFVVSTLGFIPENLPVPTPGGERPLTLAPVVIGSVVGAIGAAVVFALIGLVARRPLMLFGIVATVALVLSLAAPLTIPGAPLSMVLSLEVMHVAAWAVIVGLLTVLARRAEPSDA